MTDPHCHDLCPDCGKVRYRSRQHALTAASHAYRRSGRKVRAYRCGQFWHFTRWSADRYQARQSA